MAPHRQPGPICSTRVGDDWIDLGTTCRSRTATPGPLDAAEAAVLVATQGLSASKKQFDKDHQYSLAPEAARKRDIDLEIVADDYGRSGDISLTNPDYLKKLIELGSRGTTTVSGKANKIQFFIVRGGGEGFLGQQHLVAGNLSKQNASRISTDWRDTDGTIGHTVFDINDILVVFGPSGNFIGAALLERPLSVTGRWSEGTANAIYDKWNNKAVSIYRNTSFTVQYLGLVLDDGMKPRKDDRQKGRQHTGWVDMHKRESTNGCIFIEDPTTPDVSDPDTINKFEPKLIRDILAAINKRPEDVKGFISLGVMRVIDLSR